MQSLFPSERSYQEMGSMRCLFQATLDTISGHIIARTSEAIFSHSWADLWLGHTSNNSRQLLTKKAVRVWLQLAFTTILSYEIRGLYADTSDLIDPLGGLFFMASVMQQPKFWERLNDLSKSVYSLLITESEPEPPTEN